MSEMKPDGYLAAGSFFGTTEESAKQFAMDILGSCGSVVPLYAIPADQVLVPRELVARAIALAEDAMGIDFSEHDAIRDELRTLLHP